ncbi:MAG: hypothetical protein HETSPECPRED_007388 [Heterodermia speciosa]|uniref:Glycosyltransferase family 69 protein n=1 Tax=Heterodermia speciosa TaxID=116794 RepID=A0A8H3FUX4_9LECA|nr:MAG: hypothetical protein HETSPECPRED_007388 [Heterodermia speciosa]
MANSQNEFELDERGSSRSSEDFYVDDADFETQGLTSNSYSNPPSPALFQPLLNLLPPRITKLFSRYISWVRGRRRRRRSFLGCSILRGRRTGLVFNSVAGITLILVAFTAVFQPSYTNPPAHYENLRRRVMSSDDYGRANSDNQKIFIAASIYDKGGRLVKGAWGRNVLELLNLLGNRNTFLSIYENDSGQEARKELEKFQEEVQCNSQLVYEEHLSLEDIPKITLPDGSDRIKRIAYLAEVRNKVLKPLEDSDVAYDKILFLNDVIFNPVDAAQLLFSTNANEHGKAIYHAACAVDFINPFKFYDTFATRDLEGFSMGVPFYPWFSDAGKGLSRQDVLDGKDAVRVKSCWGGMVAFDATFLQAPILESAARTVEQRNILGSDDDEGDKEMEKSVDGKKWDSYHPIRFRARSSLHREASECCLIHADLIEATRNETFQEDTGIYQNPYIRVAYGSWTLWWLRFTRRFERLYTIPHNIINHQVGLPWPNDHRQGTKDGAGADVGGYCEIEALQLLRENPRKGEKNWESVPIPSE